ncbi:hypothetical protein AHAS_Ahas12G0125100 [Arachis hypogaea]
MPDSPFLLSKLATASCPNNNPNADPFLIPSSSSEGCSAPSSSAARSSPLSTWYQLPLPPSIVWHVVPLLLKLSSLLILKF